MLCRLAISLGGNTILPLAMETIPVMLQSGEYCITVWCSVLSGDHMVHTLL